MTLASTLFGSSSDVDFVPGNLYPARGLSVGAVPSAGDTDYLLPWSPRKTVTIDKLAWYRDIGTAANVYVGLYDSGGALLTDCAVDTATGTGWHAVDTTNVTLIAGRVYYLCWNASADVAGTWALANQTSPGNMSRVYADMVTDYGYNLTIGSAPGTATIGIYTKSRTHAALLSSLVMSGWSDGASGTCPCLGVVAA